MGPDLGLESTVSLQEEEDSGWNCLKCSSGMMQDRVSLDLMMLRDRNT